MRYISIFNVQHGGGQNLFSESEAHRPSPWLDIDPVGIWILSCEIGEITAERTYSSNLDPDFQNFKRSDTQFCRAQFRLLSSGRLTAPKFYTFSSYMFLVEK